jgi:hypothetical protein
MFAIVLRSNKAHLPVTPFLQLLSSSELGMKLVLILFVYCPTERVKHSNSKDRIRIRAFNIRNYPYCISIWIFKVGFLISKYDEYHHSTHHIMFVSESDPRIQSEKQNYLYLCPRYPFVFVPFPSLLRLPGAHLYRHHPNFAPPVRYCHCRSHTDLSWCLPV